MECTMQVTSSSPLPSTIIADWCRRPDRLCPVVGPARGIYAVGTTPREQDYFPAYRQILSFHPTSVSFHGPHGLRLLLLYHHPGIRVYRHDLVSGIERGDGIAECDPALALQYHGTGCCWRCDVCRPEVQGAPPHRFWWVHGWVSSSSDVNYLLVGDETDESGSLQSCMPLVHPV